MLIRCSGTSSGFGKRLVSSVLARGDYVIATVRNLESFTLPEGDRTRLRIIVLDVCDTLENIQSAVAEATAVWGRIDVLVNNAGYGLKSLLEEGGCGLFFPSSVTPDLSSCHFQGDSCSEAVSNKRLWRYQRHKCRPPTDAGTEIWHRRHDGQSLRLESRYTREFAQNRVVISHY